MNSPQMQALRSSPEFAPIIAEFEQNPQAGEKTRVRWFHDFVLAFAAMAKYANNPEVMNKIMSAAGSLFGGSSGQR